MATGCGGSAAIGVVQQLAVADAKRSVRPLTLSDVFINNGTIVLSRNTGEFQNKEALKCHRRS